MIFCKQSFECYVTSLKSTVIYICFCSLLQLDDTIIYWYVYLHGSGSFFYILSTKLLDPKFLVYVQSAEVVTLHDP